ncbi:uncharacterized protein ACBT57_003091 isoform 1-T1 [Dama dama]
MRGEKEKFTTCFTALVWNQTRRISEVCPLTGTASLSVLAKCVASPETRWGGEALPGRKPLGKPWLCSQSTGSSRNTQPGGRVSIMSPSPVTPGLSSVECPASSLLTPPQGLQEPERGQREQQGSTFQLRARGPQKPGARAAPVTGHSPSEPFIILDPPGLRGSTGGGSWLRRWERESAHLPGFGKP